MEQVARFRNQHERSIDDAWRQRLVSGCGDCQPTAAMPAGGTKGGKRRAATNRLDGNVVNARASR